MYFFQRRSAFKLHAYRMYSRGRKQSWSYLHPTWENRWRPAQGIMHCSLSSAWVCHGCRGLSCTYRSSSSPIWKELMWLSLIQRRSSLLNSWKYHISGAVSPGVDLLRLHTHVVPWEDGREGSETWRRPRTKMTVKGEKKKKLRKYYYGMVLDIKSWNNREQYWGKIWT